MGSKCVEHRVSMGSTLFMIINYNVIPPVTEPIFVSQVCGTLSDKKLDMST